jgi:hypothetical protein
LEASLPSHSASRWAARCPACLGVPLPAHSGSTDPVREHLLPAATTLPASSSEAPARARAGRGDARARRRQDLRRAGGRRARRHQGVFVNVVIAGLST